MRLLGWFLAALVVLVAALPWIVGGERRRLDAAARMRFPCSYVNLRDGYTCYELDGEAPAPLVVFVHGLNSPSYVWRELAAKVREAGFLTLTYDLYGRGGSDRPWADYDLDLFDHQLDALLRKTGVQGKVHLVGLSMGGIIATEFALRHPDMAASVTLVDPGGLAVELPKGAGLLTFPVLGDWLVQVTGERLLVAGHSGLVHDKRLVPGLVLQFLPQLEYAGYKRAFLSTLRHMPLADFTGRYAELGRSGLPVTLFWGDQDEVTPLAGAKLATSLVPSARLHVVEGAGHLASYEKPDEVARELVPFLRGVDAPAQAPDPDARARGRRGGKQEE